jgi:hypothetical protein
MLLMLMGIFVFVSYFPASGQAKSRRALVRRSLRIDSSRYGKSE